MSLSIQEAWRCKFAWSRNSEFPHLLMLKYSDVDGPGGILVSCEYCEDTEDFKDTLEGSESAARDIPVWKALHRTCRAS